MQFLFMIDSNHLFLNKIGSIFLISNHNSLFYHTILICMFDASELLFDLICGFFSCLAHKICISTNVF